MTERERKGVFRPEGEEERGVKGSDGKLEEGGRGKEEGDEAV